LKTIRLTITPQPKTNIKEGFQSFPSDKNMITLSILTIPANNKPVPNKIPTKKIIN
jgi:hypothetical protein